MSFIKDFQKDKGKGSRNESFMLGFDNAGKTTILLKYKSEELVLLISRVLILKPIADIKFTD